MKKKVRKLISMMLMISMLLSIFYGCTNESETNGNKNNIEEETKKIKKLPEMTTEEITLSYMCWQDTEISKALEKEFEAIYTNIDVEVMEYDIGSSGSSLQSLAAVGKLPDCFWLLGSLDVFIENKLLYDMTELWENDPDADNIIKGINEFKLGYLNTDRKWTTPVKFFPTAAFVNLDVFIRNEVKMPDMDWTWDEFEDTVEDMTRQDKVSDKHIFGTTSGCTVITWYPLASDKECIGEFGWNGSEYDMENWVYGLNLEAKWIKNENKPKYLGYGGVEQLTEKYGEGVLYPQDMGYSAIHCDNWWTWEDYWITEDWIEEQKVVFVPYMMPHVEGVENGNYIGTMDMGAISATTEYPREAYELLKFMTWGTEGWKYKIKHYPDLLEESTGNDRPVSKNHCPITLDEEVWEIFKKWHPNSEMGDSYITDMYGKAYDRSKYFDYFMNKVRESTWTCYGSQQIPGFDSWLQNVYFGNDGRQDYGYDKGLGIEQAVIYGGVDAGEYYEYLEDWGNKWYKNKLIDLKISID